MKKILIAAGVLMFSLIPFVQVSAAAPIQLQFQTTLPTLFDINLKTVNQIKGTNTSRFEFKTTGSTNPNIARWELRVWCDGNVKISLGDVLAPLASNECNGGNIALAKAPESLILFMTETNPAIKSIFSFKLKAFDKDGKWLHSEKEVFQW